MSYLKTRGELDDTAIGLTTCSFLTEDSRLVKFRFKPNGLCGTLQTMPEHQVERNMRFAAIFDGSDILGVICLLSTPLTKSDQVDR